MLIFRLFLVLGGAAFLCPREGLAEPRFGLWVEVEGQNQPYKSPQAFEEMQKFLRQGDFTDIYCQIYRGGRSWYPSMFADDRPYREAVQQGFDPLGDVIREAHKRGQKVHAWINLLRIWFNPAAPIVQIVGPEAVLQDNYGNFLLNYSREGRPPGKVGRHYALGTPAIWVEPGLPEVRRYLVETIRDLVLRYPELDGVHLDMVRYPIATPEKSGGLRRLAFGYHPKVLERFYQTVDIQETAHKKLPEGIAWDSWRRSQITLLVMEIKEMLNQHVPGMELSAAVIAWPERAHRHALQDWSTWVGGGIIDSVVPMAYTRDNKVFGELSNDAVSFARERSALMGLGAWLMVDEQDRIVSQARQALKVGADGVVLFSYSNLLSNKGSKLVRRVREAVRGS